MIFRRLEGVLQEVLQLGRGGELRVVRQQWIEGQLEEAVQRASSGIDGSNAGWGELQYAFFFVCSQTYFRKVDFPVPAFPVRNTD